MTSWAFEPPGRTVLGMAYVGTQSSLTADLLENLMVQFSVLLMLLLVGVDAEIGDLGDNNGEVICVVLKYKDQ